MKVLFAVLLALLLGFLMAPKPAAEEPRFLSKQEDEFPRLMCVDGGCSMIRNDQLNDLVKKAEKCRA